MEWYQEVEQWAMLSAGGNLAMFLPSKIGMTRVHAENNILTFHLFEKEIL